jgi:hypothetical protein
MKRASAAYQRKASENSAAKAAERNENERKSMKENMKIMSAAAKWRK